MDEYVLDVSSWLGSHPGGTFSLKHNIGRDISKFFHGGYSLENVNAVPNVTHSLDARIIANDLIVGRLEGRSQTKHAAITKNIVPVNKSGTVKNIEFEYFGKNYDY